MLNLSKDMYSSGAAPDPEGSGKQGVETKIDLTGGALGHPELIYIVRDTEVLLQADAYDDHVHLHCPECKIAGEEHGLMIRKGQKDFEYEPMVSVTFSVWEPARMMLKYPRGSGGRLRVVPFGCPWCKSEFSISSNVVMLERRR